MSPSKPKLIVIVSCLAAFAAGVAAGLLLGNARKPAGRRTGIAGELDLSPEQRDQMRQIWSEVMGTAGRTFRGRRRAIQAERDQTILDLLNDEQKAEHEKIMQEYARKNEELSKERKALFKEAEERTKQILTDKQRKKYEELLKKRKERGPRPHRGDREAGRRRPDRNPRGGE